MPCFHPLHGFRAASGGITWNRSQSTGLPMTVPCGQCIGCRLERSRQWAVRCIHEAKMHPHNCMVTLTYSDEHLPRDGSLDKRAFPLFVGRLRKNERAKVRYFHCGEYGEQFSRPHYHGLLFGYDFADKELWTTRNGFPVWRSATLEKLWKFGNSEIGSVTFESAAYIARYITKKVTGSMAEDHYERLNPLTGELVRVEPEYVSMSRRPGIGATWYEKYSSDVFPSDEVIVRGRSCKPPRYYDNQLEALAPDDLASIKRKRSRERNRADETPERLSVREVCAEASLTLLPRRLEQ